MDINSILLVSTGAIASAVTMSISSLKTIPNTVFKKISDKFIYTVNVYQYDILYVMLETYLFHHYKSKYNSVEASLSEDTIVDTYKQQRDIKDIKSKQTKDDFNDIIVENLDEIKI